MCNHNVQLTRTDLYKTSERDGLFEVDAHQLGGHPDHGGDWAQEGIISHFFKVFSDLKKKKCPNVHSFQDKCLIL